MYQYIPHKQILTNFYRNWKCFWVDGLQLRSQPNTKKSNWHQTTRLILHHAVEIAGHPTTLLNSKLLNPKIEFSWSRTWNKDFQENFSKIIASCIVCITYFKILSPSFPCTRNLFSILDFTFINNTDDRVK